MITVEKYNPDTIQQEHIARKIDPWHALQEEGAIERALNDLLGYLEDDLKVEPCAVYSSCFSEV
jgi:hypothetical protein